MKPIGQAVFCSMLLGWLGVLLGSCGGNSCATAFKTSKVEALIGQLQGRCCVYEADLDDGCQPRSQPYTGLLGRYHCPKWAARCLQSMGSEAEEAIPALIQALETGPPNYDTGDGPIPTRNAIILALGTIGDRRAVEPLLKALQTPRPSERWIFAAAASGKPRQGYDGTIQALGLLGPTAQAAVPELLPLLQQSDLYIVERTANALAQIQDPSAIPALIALLQNPAKQKIAARAVGKFGSQAEAAVPILMQMFEQAADLPSQSTALAAIKEIRGSTPFDQAQATYFQKQNQTWQSLTAIAKQQGNQNPLVINSFEKEKYYIALAEGKTLHISCDRNMMNLNSEHGEIWITQNNQKVFQASFTSFDQMQKLFVAKLKALTKTKI